MLDASDCEGCKLSHSPVPKVPGGIVIDLPGNWTVNQYGGAEGFLGWLALQPRCHRMEWSELGPDELWHLGPNIKTLDLALTNYWDRECPSDPVERVYVVYFSESLLAKPEPEKYHLHIHIIPRFRSLDKPERLRIVSGGQSWVDGWKIPRLASRQRIPRVYDPRSQGWDARVSSLMKHLQTKVTET